MLTSQQREFSRLVIAVHLAGGKLEGILSAIAESVQHRTSIDAWMIDNFYERWYRFEDAITRLKGTTIWRSVDVADEASEDDD